MTIKIVDGEYWNPETKELECFRGIILEDLREWLRRELNLLDGDYGISYKEYIIRQKELLAELEMGVSPPITPKKESFDTNFPKKFVEEVKK